MSKPWDNEPTPLTDAERTVVGKRKFQVWFSQVNQTFFEVEADNEMDAQLKARIMWRAENHTPHMCDMEELSNTPDLLRQADKGGKPCG